MDLTLPDPPVPAGSYVPWVREGHLLFVSGAICLRDGAMVWIGAVGDERTLADGQAAARLCALNLLAAVKAATGSLERIRRVVRLDGYVWAKEGFVESPAVMNGASDLMVELLGDRGQHTRTAVAVNGLPKGSTVEIAGVFALED